MGTSVEDMAGIMYILLRPEKNNEKKVTENSDFGVNSAGGHDILVGQVAGRFAYEGLFNKGTVVDIGPAETTVKASGKGRFGVTSVRAGVLFSVAQEYPQGVLMGRESHHKKSREARWNIIDNII